MHLVKGDRSVEDFTHEFLRLGWFAPDVMQDEDRASELFVIGLGSDYISISVDTQFRDSLMSMR